MTKIRITVHGDERADEICSVLRGLLYANSQTGGQSTKNKSFVQGVTLDFGSETMAKAFIASVKYFLKKSVRDRVALELMY